MTQPDDGPVAGLGRRAARGTFAMLTGQWGRFALQVAGIVILSRLLDPADFGVVAMVTAIVGIALLIGDAGLSSAAIQSPTLTIQQKSNLFWLNLLLGLLMAAGVFGLAGPIASLYGNLDLVAVTRALSLVFFAEAFRTQFTAEAARRLLFGRLSVAEVGSQFVALVVGVIAAVAGAGFWALVLQQVVASVVRLIIAVAVVPWWPTWPRKAQGMRALLSFGLNVLGAQAINYASSNIDSVLVGRFFGSTQLGLYSRAVQLFQFPMVQIAIPIGRVSLPVLSRTVGEPARFERYADRALLCVAYLLGGVMLCTAAVSLPLVEVAFGTDWARSSPIMVILAFGGVFGAQATALGWIFVASAKTVIQLKYSLIGRLTMIALIVAGSFLSPAGAAGGSALGLAVTWSLLLIFGVPKVGLKRWRSAAVMLRPLAIFGSIVAIVYPVSAYMNGIVPPIVDLLLSIGSVAVVGLLWWMLMPMARKDAREVVEVVMLALRREHAEPPVSTPEEQRLRE